MELKKIQENKTSNKLFIIMGMSTAILLVSPVLILAAFGYFLDTLFHTAPLLLILGGIVGFVSGISNVFRMMQLMQRRKVNRKNSRVTSTIQK